MGERTVGSRIFRHFAYTICIILALLSIFPFLIMFLNATRSTSEIWQNPISFLPSRYALDNFRIIRDIGAFDALLGFRNSFIVAGGTTIISIYVSSLTAYALTAYSWKMRQPFFTFIMAVMMVPAQILTIGYFTLVWQLDLANNFLPLILPAMAAPTIVFFMRQYLLATFSMDVLNSARIDGASEFRIFNQIILPMMKPAMATQAIFIFVGSWNALFLPRVLLTNRDMYTMPLMVSLLQGNIYDTEFGVVYLGLALSILPIFIVYFFLARYIIAGIQLGAVKG